MKIVFSSRALADMAKIVKFIAYDKPQAARRWAVSIRESVSKLSDFPRLGRVVPEYEDETIREIIKGQYRIVYKLDDEKQTIVIVTVHHGKKPLV
ncbi:MAG: type II toxin-antitoxin system RelE/ParE family toxin [bacterium]